MSPSTRPALALLLLASVDVMARVTHPVHISKPTTDEEATLSMRGNLLPLGIFYTTVKIGTPPQEYQVTIDTGSTDMLVPVAGCKGCKENTSHYDPDASSTSAVEGCNKTLTCKTCVDNNRQCGFSDSYLTCDLSNLTALCTVAGGIYSDTVTLGGFSAPKVRFGGITTQTTNFDQFKAIDGILGLAYKAMGFDETPFERIVAATGIDDIIQTCLTRSGGLLVLGSDPAKDREFYSGELQWTPITLDQWYTVNATKLTVAGHEMDLTELELNGPYPSDPCIVDSGTNFLSLTAPAFHRVEAAFQAMCASGLHLQGVCGVTKGQSMFDGVAYNLTKAQRDSFPDVGITLAGYGAGPAVALPIRAEDYLVKLPSGLYRLGLTMGDCIIGNTHMLRYWTVYDRTLGRLGFAPARPDRCDSERDQLLK